MPSHAEACKSRDKTVPGHDLWLLAVLSLLMGFASISTDLYLPAMPAMSRALHADHGTIELTISGYLVGFSVGQLFWGPVGDRYGRRGPIAVGLVLFIIGSAGCALSSSAWMMVGWRIVQALGACSGVVLARAMVRDLYDGARAAQMLSTLMSVMAIAPLLGPIVGGQIVALANWQAIFWALVGVGVLTLAALYSIPETLPVERQQKLGRAMANYLPLLLQRRFIGYAATGAFFYGAMYAYIAGTPFAYIDYHHVAPQLYGTLFGVGIVAIMVTNIFNAQLVARLGGLRLLRAGTIGAAVAAGVLAINARTGWGGLAGLAVPLFVFVGMTGFVVANSIVGAMAGYSERAGAASALVGALQYGTGIAGSALVGAFADGTPWTMGWVIAVFAISSVLSAWLLIPGSSTDVKEARS
jgi:DHA1 family bicyclomycin/chloramphenicol resistance-like MFS transporter